MKIEIKDPDGFGSCLLVIIGILGLTTLIIYAIQIWKP